VDRARAPARAALKGAAAQDARRPTQRLAAPHPGAALSPRGAQGVAAADAGAPRAAHPARAAGFGAQRDRDRAGADRPINEQLRPLEAELRSFARRQAGCRALQGHFGIGELTSVAILAELGDAPRFSSSRHAVRFAGLDVTVSQSDESRAPGKLSHQGPPVLRWAAFEAAQCAWRERSPDHHYYLETKARLGGKQAALTIARKLIRRAHHTLRELGDEALAPAPAT
jgi:transposase